jgi:MoaA/NifB/PqqE/SkfB family radical SAM enzyme
MYKISSRWNHQGTIKVEWNLGKRCNYDCSYCPAAIHDNTSPHTPIETLKEAVATLAGIGKPIRLSFTGGEPCVHPKFLDLLQYCRFVGIQWISVTTNGTMPFEFYSKLPVDQLVVSVHFEYDWRRVMHTIKKLSESSDIKLIAQLMAHHDYISSVKTAHGISKSSNVPCTIRRIRWTEGDHDLFDDMRYHPDDLQWILDNNSTVQGNCVIDGKTVMHANDIIKFHLNKYKGWECNIGVESLMINWDGDVHRATCRVGGSLGNIYNNSFTVPTDPIVCDRTWCTCAADIPITKVLLD